MTARAIRFPAFLAAAVLVSVTGCGGSSSTSEVRATTVGQELQDLDSARNKGLITEQEYQQKRREILKSK